MSRNGQIGGAFVHALRQNALAAGCCVQVQSCDWAPWASATFAGARHRITLEAASTEAFNDWLAHLDEADLPVPGHLVADIAIAAVRCTGKVAEADIEALTVEAV